jgi:hypothetical protein
MLCQGPTWTISAFMYFRLGTGRLGFVGVFIVLTLLVILDLCADMASKTQVDAVIAMQQV